MTELPVLAFGFMILVLLAGCQSTNFQSEEIKLPAANVSWEENVSWTKINITESPTDFGLAKGGRYCINNPDRSKNVHCDELKLKDGRIFKINCWDDLVANLICFNESEVENLTRIK